MQTKRIFLASSSELAEDRKEVQLLINRKNKDWIGRGISLELVIWEDFLDVMAQARLQEEYNRVSREGDIFLMLFWTKLGTHVREEFTTAFANPPVKRRQFIYGYFKDVPISTGSGVTKTELKPLWQFQEQLQQLGHVQAGYKNTDALKLHLGQELETLAADGFAVFDAADEVASEDVPQKPPIAGTVTPPAGASAKVSVPPPPRRAGAARLWISVALVVAIAAGAYGFMHAVQMDGMGAPASDAGAEPRAGSARSKESETAPMPPLTAAGAGDALNGQEVFAVACAVCHDAGVAGAPRMGDAAAWAPRIAQGEALLYQRSLRGYQGKDGFMPAKGGRPDLSDQSVINAVNHMVANSK
jgi:cytochrome c5